VYTLEYGEALDAHGFIQKMLVETGIFGLVAFVGFLGWVLQTIAKQVRRDVFYQALLCMVAGAMVFQLFNTSYLNSVLWLPIGLALAGVSLKKTV
jgi:O-antigen ligase